MITHLIEDRNAVISPWGKGNSKLGSGIYTYSKLPGREHSCPGSSSECERMCYAKRLVANKPVWELLTANTKNDTVPPLPPDAQIVRIHVSGDFDTNNYIASWVGLVCANPGVKFFGYTRSWRVKELLYNLEQLRSLPNVWLWASMDKSITELPPEGWRRAWIAGDSRLTPNGKHYLTFDGRKAIVCLEENGSMPDCETCTLCFATKKNDLVFIEHGPKKE